VRIFFLKSHLVPYSALQGSHVRLLRRMNRERVVGIMRTALETGGHHTPQTKLLSSRHHFLLRKRPLHYLSQVPLQEHGGHFCVFLSISA